MFWADKIAKEIIDSGRYKPYWVDDMKTPSGRIHVGSLRGVVIHDLVYKALIDLGQKVIFTWVFEDHDPMDALPYYLEASQWSNYLGQPLFTIPSPDGKAKSYAHYFALEFQEVFNSIGSHPEILWTSELYKTGKMNDGIKKCLDHITIIREIYETTYKKKLSANWYPFQVVCQKCGKESTTKVTAWDGNEITYGCHVHAVDWTRGCGYKGKSSPFSSKGKFVGKLSWKVEWAVKWMAIGVTVEGAGKDHMSAGGSHDIAKQVCERVLHYPVPYPIAYEFFLVGGRKMSSSKGIGTSSKEISDILPPYLLRFLFTRTDYNQAIDFDPVGNMYIPDLFDEYDRCWKADIKKSNDVLSRIFELSNIDNGIKMRPPDYIPRFRDVANYLQLPNVDIKKRFAILKRAPLSLTEQNIISERKRYARLWLQKYAPAEYHLQMTDSLPSEAANLSLKQREYLNAISMLIDYIDDPAALQQGLYDTAKKIALDTKAAFECIYLIFLGKTSGPQAAWFLLQYPKDQIIRRIQVALKAQVKSDVKVKIISKPDLFSIDQAVRHKYPSVSIGIALIKNVNIIKSEKKLDKEKTDTLGYLAGLTTEGINKFSEITSYRRLYNDMGIDWHSRRPSPEALLRRVALGKGLYTVNTAVDAYNLVVMKTRVSVGAFDFNEIKFPTVLRFAKARDAIILLGDKELMKYKVGELAYYDQTGGYNIDFNYRDAERTKVTEKTKNIWINVDGVYDITPAKVEKTLQESIEIILKYCGGKLDVSGVVV